MSSDAARWLASISLDCQAAKEKDLRWAYLE